MLRGSNFKNNYNEIINLEEEEKKKEKECFLIKKNYLYDLSSEERDNNNSSDNNNNNINNLDSNRIIIDIPSTSSTSSTIPNNTTTTTTTTTTTNTTTTNTTTTTTNNTPPKQINEELFTILFDMGYEEEQIHHVLLRCNSVSTAVEMLNHNPEEEHEVYKSQCPICFDEYPLQEMITLNCLHRLCLDCFSSYCESKINDNEIDSDQLCCPVMIQQTNTSSSTVGVSSKCSQPITIHEIKAHVSSKIFEKYEKFLTKSFCENEKLTSCPKCNEWYVDLQEVLHLEHKWKKIKCEKCSHEFCGKCGQVPHKGQDDQDIDCEAYAKWMEENSNTDDNFLKYINKNKLFSCPKCKMFGALESGCKFMYCRCRENYCALCGKKLNQSEHFSHFNGVPGATGPFGNVCLGMKDKKNDGTDESASNTGGRGGGRGGRGRRGGRGGRGAIMFDADDHDNNGLMDPIGIAAAAGYVGGVFNNAANYLFGPYIPAVPPPVPPVPVAAAAVPIQLPARGRRGRKPIRIVADPLPPIPPPVPVVPPVVDIDIDDDNDDNNNPVVRRRKRRRRRY